MTCFRPGIAETPADGDGRSLWMRAAPASRSDERPIYTMIRMPHIQQRTVGDFSADAIELCYVVERFQDCSRAWSEYHQTNHRRRALWCYDEQIQHGRITIFRKDHRERCVFMHFRRFVIMVSLEPLPSAIKQGMPRFYDEFFWLAEGGLLQYLR